MLVVHTSSGETGHTLISEYVIKQIPVPRLYVLPRQYLRRNILWDEYSTRRCRLWVFIQTNEINTRQFVLSNRVACSHVLCTLPAIV